MAIDLSVHVSAGFLAKWISVGKLKSLLDQLDDLDTLQSNKVGNFSIVNVEGKCIGYIDIAGEELEISD